VSTTPEAASGLDPALAAALNTELIRHARLLHALKSSMATVAPEGLDLAAVGLLINLVRCGPRRQGELAELSFLDPSTVSRHVAQLARAGYLQRRADPQDGRAVQLVATADGERVADDLAERRQAMIREALDGWAPEDARRLVELLRRLNDDLDAFRPRLVKVLAEPPARSRLAPSDQLPDLRDPDEETA